MFGSARRKYADLVRRAAADGALSPIEVAELHRHARTYRLEEFVVCGVHAEVVREFAERAAADGMVTAQEAAYVDRLANALAVTQPSLSDRVRHARQVGQVVDAILQGQIPVIPPAQLPIAVREPVHLCLPCAIYENKVVGRHTVGGSSGMSFWIAKGVSFRTGGFRGHSVPVYEMVQTSEGPLMLTATHVRYFGERKGFQKPWSKIAGVEPYVDGVTIHFADRANATTLLYQAEGYAAYVEAICAAKLSS